MFADVLVKLFPARARRSLFRVLGLLQRWVPERVEEEACDMFEKLREAAFILVFCLRKMIGDVINMLLLVFLLLLHVYAFVSCGLKTVASVHHVEWIKRSKAAAVTENNTKQIMFVEHQSLATLLESFGWDFEAIMLESFGWDFEAIILCFRIMWLENCGQ
ncbi:hypothetical protein SADUNF_Sadunf19G0069300 [Salix dunnii]|uniref:Uncharacterized protein n=1 Tax=Salix dunnii TaxID=1413687 RepID=A0A835IYT3_9ROSI|nr:hypothetical protein SADUNF_Sadunf19G0069300 [Salix dunnii]